MGKKFNQFIVGSAVVASGFGAMSGTAGAGQHLTPDNFFDAMKVSQQQKIGGLDVERGGYDGNTAIRVTDDAAQNSTMIVDKGNGTKELFVLNMVSMGGGNKMPLLGELRADKGGELSFKDATTGDKGMDKSLDLNKKSPEAADFSKIAQNAITVAASAPAPTVGPDGGLSHSTQTVQKGRNIELKGSFMGDKFGPGGQEYELNLKSGNETFEGLTQDMMRQLGKGKTGFDGMTIQGKHELAKDMTDAMLSDVTTASGQKMGPVVQVGGTVIEMSGSALSPAAADANLRESLKAVPRSLDPRAEAKASREAQQDQADTIRAERKAKIEAKQAEQKAAYEQQVDAMRGEAIKNAQEGTTGRYSTGSPSWHKKGFNH
jgi:hypothetical protein